MNVTKKSSQSSGCAIGCDMSAQNATRLSGMSANRVVPVNSTRFTPKARPLGLIIGGGAIDMHTLRRNPIDVAQVLKAMVGDDVAY